MFITMLADITAFISLVFGYFFYWTLRRDFPPDSIMPPGLAWCVPALALLLGAWLLTVLAHRWNKADRTALFYAGLAAACLLSLAGTATLVAAPWQAALDPKQHVYSATVWLLVIWTGLHVVLGVIMQLYCIARRAAGRMTGRYDIDISNVTLYWHFVAITVAITVAVIAFFPLLQ
jgi:cytochrome c oxidase subunit I+III